MNTISQGTVRPYIINSLVSHGGEAHGSIVTAEALVAIGADPLVESNRQAVANARHDLKGRGCVIDGAKRGNWMLTDAGRAVHGGAPLPPYVRAPKADTGKPLVEVFAPEAPTPVVEPAPEPAPELAKADTVSETETAIPVVETPVAVEPVIEAAPVETAPVVEAPVVVETPVTVEPEAAPVPPPVEAAPVEAAPAPAPKRRLKVATAVPAVVVPEWVRDEGLRAMVVEATECFGLWSAKATGCGECVLAGWCRNAKASVLVVLAGKIKTETPETPAPVTKSVANLDAEVSKGNAPDASRSAPNPEGEGFVVKATHDTVCGLTGAPIRKGDAVRYVRGTGLVLV